MSRVTASYTATLIGYLGLIVLLTLWNGWLAPSQYFPKAMVLLVLVGPLMLPLRGILHGRPYTYAWSSYLALLYFVLGVGDLFAHPEQRPLAALEVIFSLMMYTGAILFARFRGQQLNAG